MNTPTGVDAQVLGVSQNRSFVGSHWCLVKAYELCLLGEGRSVGPSSVQTMLFLTPQTDDWYMPNSRGAARYAARKMMQRQARTEGAAQRSVARSTAGESALFRRLTACSPFHWYAEQPLGDYRADFYCPSARLVVEVDGSSHDNRHVYDRQRDADLAAYGIETFRITNDQVLLGSADIVERINTVCRQRSGRSAERPLTAGSTSKPSVLGLFLRGLLGGSKPGRATPGSSTNIYNAPWVRRGKARPAVGLQPPLSPSSRAASATAARSPNPVTRAGLTSERPYVLVARSGLFRCDICLRFLPIGDRDSFKGVCAKCVHYM
jgi:very-short-patch-repair endonuclease